MEVEVVELTAEEKAVVELHYSRESAVRDLVRTAPPSLTLPRTLATRLHLVRGVQVRQDDIWVVTPPKCGTTWLRELAWLVTHNADVDKVNTY